MVGELESSSSLEFESGDSKTVTFSVSNTGSTDTESAKALISSPNGFSHPSSIILKEAGQDDGVIRADKSAGSRRFDISANNGFNTGTLQIELTSSEIGVTDTLEIDLAQKSDEGTNDEETDDTNDSPSSTGPSGPSGPVAPANPNENQTDNQTSNENKTDDRKDKPDIANTSRKNVVAESRNGVARVNITKGEGVNEISVSVNPASDKAAVKNIRITSGKSGQVSVSVRDVGRDKPPQVPEHASRDEENVYSYQEINASINDSEIDVAEVDFSVNKSWVEKVNASRDDVVMKRFNNGSWNSLETRYLNETDTEYNFEASSEGFSYYAVALEEPANQTEEEQMNSENESSQQSNYMIYLLVVLGLVAVVGVVYLRKSGNSENTEFDMDSY